MDIHPKIRISKTEYLARQINIFERKVLDPEIMDIHPKIRISKTEYLARQINIFERKVLDPEIMDIHPKIRILKTEYLARQNHIFERQVLDPEIMDIIGIQFRLENISGWIKIMIADLRPRIHGKIIYHRHSLTKNRWIQTKPGHGGVVYGK